MKFSEDKQVSVVVSLNDLYVLYRRFYLIVREQWLFAKATKQHQLSKITVDAMLEFKCVDCLVSAGLLAIWGV